MPQKKSPFLDANYGWEYGEDAWNGGMDENLLKFSYLFDSNIDGIVSNLPSPVNGTAYYLTTDNRVYFAVEGSFHSITLPKWFELTMRSSGVRYIFNGSTIQESPSISDIEIQVANLESSKADVDSPELSGTPTTPTPSASNPLQIANVQFVNEAVADVAVVRVEDQGSVVSEEVKTLNFIGNAVTATEVSDGVVAVNINALPIDGVAVAAEKLSTIRSISLTGDATGSTSFDGGSNVQISTVLANTGVTAGTYNNSSQIHPLTVDSKGRITNVGTPVTVAPSFESITGKPTTLGGYGITDALATSVKGVANGVASLGEDGKVPSSQLPSYVDDVLEFTNQSSFPAVGDVGKIYLAQDTNNIYRWSGSTYIRIASDVSTADAATKLVTPRNINGVPFDGTSDITVVDSTKEPTIALGTTSQYWRGDKTWNDFPSTVRSSTLTGFSTAISTSVTSSDTVLSGMGKLQAQVNGKLGSTATAVAATKLSTARTISTSGDATGSTTFDGTSNANIGLTLSNSGVVAGAYTKVTVDVKGRVIEGANLAPSDVPTLNQDTTGNAATATKLATARTINGVSFDGTNSITITATDPSKEPAITSGTTSQYWRGDKSWVDFGTSVRSSIMTGLSTATDAAITASDTVISSAGKLQSQINALKSGKLDASANAVSASKLSTSRTISLAGDVVGSVSFDGSANVEITASLAPNAANESIVSISSSANAVRGTRYVTSTSLTLTLPSNPTIGDIVGITLLGSRVVIVARNGSNIMGLAENLCVNIPDYPLRLTYINSAQGWVLT